MNNDQLKPPERIWVQIASNGGTISYNRDPREVHDNGKPVYVYTRAVTATGDVRERVASCVGQWITEMTDSLADGESIRLPKGGITALINLFAREFSTTADREEAK